MLNSSSNQTDASLELLNERQLSPDMADTSSFDTTSSSDAGGYRANIPLLLSIESPLVSAVVTILCATNKCRKLFSNEGEDIVNQITYDSEWWRRMPDSASRPENTQGEWEQAIRIELQVLSAFLAGKMHRQLAATGHLESLFRMKKNRHDEPKLEISTIFKILAQLPELENALVSKVRVDGDIALVLPVPVSTNRPVSVQRALDETFWASALDTNTDSADLNVPYLEDLTDVLVVYCLEKGIKLSEKIYPERYSSETAEQIQRRLGFMKSLTAKQNKIQRVLSKSTALNGRSVVESIELAAQAMKAAENTEAYEELLEKAEASKKKKTNLQEEADSITSQLELSSKNLLDPSQEASMSPYSVRALIWPDAGSNGPIVIYRAEPSELWHYICGSSYYKISWSDVTKYAVENENYSVVYERGELYDSYEMTLAPSVKSFIDQDNIAFDETRSEDSDDNDRTITRNIPSGGDEDSAHDDNSSVSIKEGPQHEDSNVDKNESS